MPMTAAPDPNHEPAPKRGPLRIVVRRPREFNVALLRIVDGKGPLLESLGRLTGLSVDSIKARVKRARFDYPGEAIDGPADRLDADEMRYLSRMYGRSNDPEVRDFVMRTIACQRRRPDWRSAKDREPRET